MKKLLILLAISMLPACNTQQYQPMDNDSQCKKLDTLYNEVYNAKSLTGQSFPRQPYYSNILNSRNENNCGLALKELELEGKSDLDKLKIVK